MFKVKVDKRVAKKLQRLPAKEYLRLSKAIKGLAHSPQRGNLKQLSGKYIGSFRLRVGGWRILFVRDEKAKEVRIYRLETRGDVY